MSDHSKRYQLFCERDGHKFLALEATDRDMAKVMAKATEKMASGYQVEIVEFTPSVISLDDMRHRMMGGDCG